MGRWLALATVLLCLAGPARGQALRGLEPPRVEVPGVAATLERVGLTADALAAAVRGELEVAGLGAPAGEAVLLVRTRATELRGRACAPAPWSWPWRSR